MIKEYIDENHRKYSFHWQDMASNLILRWDNAPHHKQISTFPHHRHLASGDIKESFDISFDEIMEYIRKQI